MDSLLIQIYLLVSVVYSCIYSHSITMYYRIKRTKKFTKTHVITIRTKQSHEYKAKTAKNKVTKTYHIIQDKNDQKNKKTAKIKSQNHKTIHSTVQYSDSHISLHIIGPKNITKKNIIALVIKLILKLIIQ